MQACVRHETGTLYLQNTRSWEAACERGDTATQWSIRARTGPQGAPGQNGPAVRRAPTALRGRPDRQGRPARSATPSPNGLFTITLSNQGILLRGPRGT